MTTPVPDKRTERLAQIIRFALTLAGRGMTTEFHVTTAKHISRLIQLATLLNKRWRCNFKVDDAQYQLHFKRIEQTASELNPLLSVKSDGGHTFVVYDVVDEDGAIHLNRVAIPVWESN